LERGEPRDAKVLVLIEKPLDSNLSASLGVITGRSLPLMELDVIAQEHVDGSTFEVG